MIPCFFAIEASLATGEEEGAAATFRGRRGDAVAELLPELGFLFFAAAAAAAAAAPAARRAAAEAAPEGEEGGESAAGC